MTPVKKLVALATDWPASANIPLRVVSPDKKPMHARIQTNDEDVTVMDSETVAAVSVVGLALSVRFEIITEHLFVKILKID